MRRDGTRTAAETDAAGSEALKGGIAGAAKVQSNLVSAANLLIDECSMAPLPQPSVVLDTCSPLSTDR